MTRGKYAAKAAVRKEVTERDQQIDSYQHAIRNLTAENTELKQKLADQQAAHSKTVRVLKAERDEGLSPMVAVLQKENQAMKERVDRAEERVRVIQQGWDNAARKVHVHFQEVHGYTGTEAAEVALNLIGSEPRYLSDNPRLRDLSRTDPEGARKIERARGIRK